jgi:hypothetical protein
MPVEQAGFSKGRGTRDQIANVRWLLERTRERNKPVYLCFIDYAKAFDSVEHSKMWNSMRHMGIPEHLIGLIRDLYTEQEAKVQVEQGTTDWFPVQKVVRQGCILSPDPSLSLSLSLFFFPPHTFQHIHTRQKPLATELVTQHELAIIGKRHLNNAYKYNRK